MSRRREDEVEIDIDIEIGDENEIIRNIMASDQDLGAAVLVIVIVIVIVIVAVTLVVPGTTMNPIPLRQIVKNAKQENEGIAGNEKEIKIKIGAKNIRSIEIDPTLALAPLQKESVPVRRNDAKNRIRNTPKRNMHPRTRTIRSPIHPRMTRARRNVSEGA